MARPVHEDLASASLKYESTLHIPVARDIILHDLESIWKVTGVSRVCRAESVVDSSPPLNIFTRPPPLPHGSATLGRIRLYISQTECPSGRP